MSVDEYMSLTPYATELEENWGKAPGTLNTDGKDMLIYGYKYVHCPFPHAFMA